MGVLWVHGTPYHDKDHTLGAAVITARESVYARDTIPSAHEAPPGRTNPHSQKTETLFCRLVISAWLVPAHE
jgi:hypothetical protein